jgi:hypothetical protein
MYLYGMETFALAMLVHYTASRSCTIAVSEGGCGCWVFVDMSHTGGPSNLALLPIRAGFWVSLSAWQKRHTATRLHSHRPSVSGNWLPLSYFKLGVRSLFIGHSLAGGLRISTTARQPLELERSARDRTIIS